MSIFTPHFFTGPTSTSNSQMPLSPVMPGNFPSQPGAMVPGLHTSPPSVSSLNGLPSEPLLHHGSMPDGITGLHQFQSQVPGQPSNLGYPPQNCKNFCVFKLLVDDKKKN